MDNLMKKILYIAIVLAGLTGCQFLEKHQQRDTVAEVAGQRLTASELQQITGKASTPEDSARYAEAYIRQWAEEILVYEKAKDQADAEVERLVEDYRRSLYVHAYEQRLVQQRMNKTIEDSVVNNYYESHRDQFILGESLLKGILLIVPNGAPKLDKLKKQLAEPDEENIEHIEKYAYQYATGYELFTRKWMPATHIVLRLPLETNNLVQQLKKSDLIEVQDSLSTYLLQVTDKCLPGEVMPIEYARPEIEEILLAQRQSVFLREQRNNLYRDAVKFKKLKIYAKD